MRKLNKRPPVHPGRILEHELEEAGLSANVAALALRIPANRLTEIHQWKPHVGRHRHASRELLRNIRADVDEPAILLRPSGRGGSICRENRTRG